MKKILLPTDFSEGSKVATDYAIAIAEMINASIDFLHIMVTPLDWVNLPLEKEKLYPDTKADVNLARKQLHELEKYAHSKGIKANSSLHFNKSREAIEEHAQGNEYELVVMGSHGSKGLREYVIGSNAQKVIRNSAVPVLVVKTRPESFSFRKIVFASNFQDSQMPSFLKVLGFAENLISPLHLLYVNTPYFFKETGEMEYMLKSFCENFSNITFQTHIYDAFNEERGIAAFMEDKKMDMLAIATEGKSGLKQIVSPSLAESLINHLDNPVLTINFSKTN
jgi:nucleotide-binding universal stress UspA family protein